MFDRLPRLSFQLESRELFARQDLAEQRRFHAEHVVYSDDGEVNRMLAAGLGIRVTAPLRILSGSMKIEGQTSSRVGCEGC